MALESESIKLLKYVDGLFIFIYFYSLSISLVFDMDAAFSMLY